MNEHAIQMGATNPNVVWEPGDVYNTSPKLYQGCGSFRQWGLGTYLSPILSVLVSLAADLTAEGEAVPLHSREAAALERPH